MWIGVAELNIEPIDAPWSYQTLCEMSFGIGTQTGGEFSGSTTIQGRGASSDRQCVNLSKFTGTISPDGTLTSLQFDPPLHHGRCTYVSGEVHFTGSTDESAFTAETPDRNRWTCTNEVGTEFDGEQTIRIRVNRRSTGF